MKLTQRTKEIYAKVVAWIKLILQHIIPCTKAAYGKAREFVKRPISISKFSMILSLYTLVVFHIPVLKVVWEGVDFDFSGMVIFFSFLTLLFVLNYFVTFKKTDKPLRFKLAMIFAAVTAPYTFLIPTSWLYM